MPKEKNKTGSTYNGARNTPKEMMLPIKTNRLTKQALVRWKTGIDIKTTTFVQLIPRTHLHVP